MNEKESFGIVAKNMVYEPCVDTEEFNSCFNEKGVRIKDSQKNILIQLFPLRMDSIFTVEGKLGWNTR